MDTATLVLIMMIVILFLLSMQLARPLWTRRKRTEPLSNQFMTGYSRPVFHAEQDFGARRRPARTAYILPLSDEQKNHFTLEWLAVQALFARNPGRGIKEAEQVLRNILRAKGYPADDLSQLTTAMALDFPAHETQFRKLHLLAMRSSRENMGKADLYRVMLHARILFEEILYADLVEAPSH